VPVCWRSIYTHTHGIKDKDALQSSAVFAHSVLAFELNANTPALVVVFLFLLFTVMDLRGLMQINKNNNNKTLDKNVVSVEYYLRLQKNV